MKIREAAQGAVSVIFVVGNLRATGPAMQLLYLISNLDRSLFKPIVFVTTKSPVATEIEDRLRQIGVEVVKLHSGKLVSIFAAPRRLAQIAEREKQVVLHPYGFRSDIISWMSGVRPRIGNVRNNLRYNYQRTFGAKIGALVSMVNLFFLRRANLVVSCGVSIRANLAGLGLCSIAIRNAIDPTVYRSLRCTGTTECPPTTSMPTYVTVASSIPGKNVEFLVEQFVAVTDRMRKLLVIGPVSSDLIESHRNSPNVDFRGHVSMPGDVFLEANFFVSASEHEGIPNAVLEALMLGRPVVLSDIPAHREVLDRTGHEVGEIFSLNPSSFASALRKIEQQGYDELAKRSKDSARLRLNAAEMARQYQFVYDALASNSMDELGAKLAAIVREE